MSPKILSLPRLLAKPACSPYYVSHASSPSLNSANLTLSLSRNISSYDALILAFRSQFICLRQIFPHWTSCKTSDRRYFYSNVNLKTPSKSTVSVRNSIHVWEQTQSACVATSKLQFSNENEREVLNGKGGILYRPRTQDPRDDTALAIGWEIVPHTSKRELNSITFILTTFKRKHPKNIQDVPMIHHFLPANYPESVCSSYSTYASYCFLGSIAGSSAMVLSTQALLVAVGVGTQSAAPMAAALNWVMKDGVGQLGGVIFASQLGKGRMDVDRWKNKFSRWNGFFLKDTVFSNASSFVRGNYQKGTADSNPKRWRMVAALALDISTLIEICTPWMGPEWFLPYASVANIGKNIGFLAGSASKASIHQSLCTNCMSSSSELKVHNSFEGEAATKQRNREVSYYSTNSSNNLGDVTAKAGSQAILASLFGTALGVFLSHNFCSDYGTAGILVGFIILSGVHQLSTYRALRAVPLRTLDRHRLHLLLSSYITENYRTLLDRRQKDTIIEDNGSELRVLTPSQVAEKDFYLPLIPPDDSVNWLMVGAPLLEVCPSGVDELKRLLIPTFGFSSENNSSNDSGNHQYEKYIIKIQSFSVKDSKEINDYSFKLTFLEDASEIDLIQGMFHAYIAHAIIFENDFRRSTGIDLHSNIRNSLDETGYMAVRVAHDITIYHIPLFLDHLRRAGWLIGPGYVNIECGSSRRFRIQQTGTHQTS